MTIGQSISFGFDGKRFDLRSCGGFNRPMINPYEPARDPAEFEEIASPGEFPPSSEPIAGLTEPLSVVMKSLLAYAGICVPIGSFFIASGGVPDGPEWQTGFLGDKLSFALSAYAGFVVYPFVFFAIACFTSYLIYDKTQPARPAVRFVLLGGVFLALFYTVVLWVVLCRSIDTWLILAACQIGLPVMVFGVPMIARRLPFRWSPLVKFGSLGLLLIGIVAVVLTETGGNVGIVFGATIGFPIAASLFCAPVWALLAYGFVSVRIAYDPRPSPGATEVDWLAGLAYWIAMLGAMPLSIRLSWVHYSRLPTEPPPGDCYVVTAAARGHRRFVGSWTESNQGETVVVNHQLRRLRVFEKELASRWPRFHFRLRRIYNQIGPKMARLLCYRWLADLAYITLKPIEWCAVVFGKLIDGKAP